MTKTIRLAFFIVLSILIYSCEDFLKEEPSIYERPDWLAGKVFTQIEAQESLSTFAECVKRSGYDTIIDVSGSYTVFAPNNQAFDEFFSNHPVYNSVNDLPQEAITDLVKFHIVQNPWSKAQLRSLDIYGWIDSTDLQNNKPRGFKRETLLRIPDRAYGVTFERKRSYIVEDDEALIQRRVATDSRKYAPVFFSEYFDIYDLSSADYSFYFNRPFESSEIYYADGQIIGSELAAENGFVYEIDKVVSPLKSAYEILEAEYEGYSYSKYLSLLNKFPEFDYNEGKTLDQPGAEEGAEVDSLFDLSYPELAFNVVYEGTQPPTSGFSAGSAATIRYHHGMVAPTNAALEAFTQEFLSGSGRWGELEDAPEHIQRIVVNSHMSKYPIYPANFATGFNNGERDLVTVNENNIIQKEFGSNATFIGVDEAIVPRAFKSVTGPIYLQSGYSRAMYAIEETGLLTALKRQNEDYTLFVESDINLRSDSSLLYDPVQETWRAFITGGAIPQGYSIYTGDLRRLILNHVGTSSPDGVARKEFVKNLAGNILVFNNETGEVSGTNATTAGFSGRTNAPNFPRQISTNADNGTTYEIDNWFSFSVAEIQNVMASEAPAFHNLIDKAELINSFNRYTFISESEQYTVFAPTDEAITASGADTLEGQDLRDFIMLHFVQGDVIFTDGKHSPGYYETVRRDAEKSTEFATVYSQIYIEPGIDYISLSDTTGNVYYTVEEAEGMSNHFITRIMELEDDDDPVFEPAVNAGVIHLVDKAFDYDAMDTE